jgi:hypothetical protein
MSLTDVISSLFGRRRPVPPAIQEPRAGSRQWISNPYHAVGIAPGLCACEAVRPFVKKRYLAREAPDLPVVGCTERKCVCHYKHFDDRRSGPRRASDKAGPPRGWNGSERRNSPGRRASDGR